MLSRGLKWLARVFFVAALAAAVYGRLLHRSRTEKPQPAPPPPVAIDWPHEPFRDWSSKEDGIRLEYPARFDETRGFGKFTSRGLLNGVSETDLVAFRSGVPRCVITIAMYQAPQPLSWEQWTALAKASIPEPASVRSKEPSVFAAEFGGSQRRFHALRVRDRTALEIYAQGAVKYPIRGNETMELWDLHSRMFARGAVAVRITGGVLHEQLKNTKPAIDRALSSFRWNPPPDTPK